MWAGWSVNIVSEVVDWFERLDGATHQRVVYGIEALAEGGPGLGRPLVDTVSRSWISNLKELRLGSVRILFVFDPWRACVLLAAGDKADQWVRWYERAVPLAERRYETYLKQRVTEEEGRS